MDPIGALAHLQLGRVLALSGDKIKAKAAYEAFLALWKDADPDVPVLKSANDWSPDGEESERQKIWQPKSPGRKKRAAR